MVARVCLFVAKVQMQPSPERLLQLHNTHVSPGFALVSRALPVVCDVAAACARGPNDDNTEHLTQLCCYGA